MGNADGASFTLVVNAFEQVLLMYLERPLMIVAHACFIRSSFLNISCSHRLVISSHSPSVSQTVDVVGFSQSHYNVLCSPLILVSFSHGAIATLELFSELYFNSFLSQRVLEDRVFTSRYAMHADEDVTRLNFAIFLSMGHDLKLGTM
jgi:hypothetical protein